MLRYYLTVSGKNKGFHNFSKNISLKVGVKPWLEFELTYCGVAEKYVSHQPPLYLFYSTLFPFIYLLFNGVCWNAIE